MEAAAQWGSGVCGRQTAAGQTPLAASEADYDSDSEYSEEQDVEETTCVRCLFWAGNGRRAPQPLFAALALTMLCGKCVARGKYQLSVMKCKATGASMPGVSLPRRAKNDTCLVVCPSHTDNTQLCVRVLLDSGYRRSAKVTLTLQQADAMLKRRMERASAATVSAVTATADQLGYTEMMLLCSTPPPVYHQPPLPVFDKQTVRAVLRHLLNALEAV